MKDRVFSLVEIGNINTMACFQAVRTNLLYKSYQQQRKLVSHGV